MDHRRASSGGEIQARVSIVSWHTLIAPVRTASWKKGGMWLTEMVGYPRPMMPSNLPATNAIPGSFTASAKRTLGTETSPTVTVSCETHPESDPDPYWMLKSVPFLT